MLEINATIPPYIKGMLGSILHKYPAIKLEGNAIKPTMV